MATEFKTININGNYLFVVIFAVKHHIDHYNMSRRGFKCCKIGFYIPS